MITQGILDEATGIVRRHFGPTPAYAWPLLAEAVGAEVWVKHENATPTGAFKVRGGLVYMERLRRERLGVSGIVSATRGNHGQSLAYAGRHSGVPVVIVVPHGNSVEKNAAMAGFGAQLVVHGADFQEAREYSVTLARERGLEPVPPLHLDLVAGVATYAKEFFDAAGELDAVFVPVGMGSGCAGLMAVRDLLGLRTKIIGVVSELAPAYALSFSAGNVISTESAHTFIDGVACRQPDPTAFAAMRQGVSHFVRVSDDEAAAAMRLMFRTTHQLPCPSGACALAALIQEKQHWQGRRVGVVMTSSNVDTDVAAAVLSGTTPSP